MVAVKGIVRRIGPHSGEGKGQLLAAQVEIPEGEDGVRDVHPAIVVRVGRVGAAEYGVSEEEGAQGEDRVGE